MGRCSPESDTALVIFATLITLARAWLAHYHTHGTTNWDVVLSRLLSIVLISSLAARDGDVVRSNIYKGAEYMQYRHVDLYLEGNEPVFEALRAVVTIEYAKGHKNTHGAERKVYLRPLEGKVFQLSTL